MTNQPVAVTGYRGAWRWGLLFGLLQVALQYGIEMMVNLLLPGASALAINLVGIIQFGLSLLLCGYAGYCAAKRSGSPYTGNSAGLYAGLVSVIISLTIWLLLIFTTNSPFWDLAARFPIFLAVAAGCTIVIYSLLALIAGIIGGKLAQRSMATAG